MIHSNYIFAGPNLIEKPIHDSDSLIPDQLIIPLIEMRSLISEKSIGNYSDHRTSEKAGAPIFLYFFHSSPSEAIILGP